MIHYPNGYGVAVFAAVVIKFNIVRCGAGRTYKRISYRRVAYSSPRRPAINSITQRRKLQIIGWTNQRIPVGQIDRRLVENIHNFRHGIYASHCICCNQCYRFITGRCILENRISVRRPVIARWRFTKFPMPWINGSDRRCCCVIELCWSYYTRTWNCKIRGKSGINSHNCSSWIGACLLVVDDQLYVIQSRVGKSIWRFLRCGCK